MVVSYKNILLCFVVFLFSCVSQKIDGNVVSQSNFNSALENFKNEKYTKAKDEFINIIYDNPLSEHVYDCQFYIAECEYNLNNYNQAIVDYSKYLRSNYKRTSFAVKSELMLCRCHYQLSLEHRKDQSATYVALEKLQYYIEKKTLEDYRSEISNMIKDLRNKLARKDFETANLYITLKDPKVDL